MVWGISKTASGGDYAVWTYNVAAIKEWAVSPIGGAGIAIAVDPVTYNVWLLNHNGTLFVSYVYDGGLGIYNYSSWTQVNDMLDGGSIVPWPGLAQSLGVGPNGAVWLVNNQPWQSGSPDHQIFAMDEFNSATNSAWTLQPGGALSVNVSAAGVPWIINHNGSLFYGVGGWPAGEDDALVKTAGGGSTTGAQGSDAGRDATLGVAVGSGTGTGATGPREAGGASSPSL